MSEKMKNEIKSIKMNNKNNAKESYSIALVVICLVAVVALTVFVVSSPDAAKKLSNDLFMLSTTTLGSTTMLYGLVYFLMCMLLAFSKYGNIKLGHGKPEHSNFTWFTMMFLSSCATATVYWGFNEWAYIYSYMVGNFAGGGATNLIGGNITNATALELSTAYNFFEWGPTVWALMCLPGIPMGYHYYNRQTPSWKLSVSCVSIIGEKNEKGFVGKLISVIGLISVFTALGYSMSLAVDMIAGPLTHALGITNTFTIKITMMLFITLLFSMSSFIGIEKGMKRISGSGAYIAIGFAIYILFAGGFALDIFDGTLSSVGLTLQEYFRLSTWVDPVAESGFAQNWPVFYMFSWILYAPYVGMFIAKISKGRTIRATVMCCCFAGWLGILFLHGIWGGYTKELMLSGAVDVMSYVQAGDGAGLIIDVLTQLPLANVVLVVFAIVSILFIATNLDAGANTLSLATVKNLPEGKEPNPFLKLFWCLLLSAYPLALVFINADIPTIKSLTTVVAIPIFVIVGIQTAAFIKDLKMDYGNKSVRDIQKEFEVVE